LLPNYPGIFNITHHPGAFDLSYFMLLKADFRHTYVQCIFMTVESQPNGNLTDGELDECQIQDSGNRDTSYLLFQQYYYYMT
jgi:hypothetical protein